MHTKSIIIIFKKIPHIFKAIKTGYYNLKYKYIEYINNKDIINENPFDMASKDDYDTEAITAESASEPTHIDMGENYCHKLYHTDSDDGRFLNISGDVAESGNIEAA